MALNASKKGYPGYQNCPNIYTIGHTYVYADLLFYFKSDLFNWCKAGVTHNVRERISTYHRLRITTGHGLDVSECQKVIIKLAKARHVHACSGSIEMLKQVSYHGMIKSF